MLLLTYIFVHWKSSFYNSLSVWKQKQFTYELPQKTEFLLSIKLCMVEAIKSVIRFVEILKSCLVFCLCRELCNSSIIWSQSFISICPANMSTTFLKCALEVYVCLQISDGFKQLWFLRILWSNGDFKFILFTSFWASFYSPL